MPLSGNPLDAPLPLPDLLHMGLAQQPDSIALVSTATRWTWHELEARTNNLAANLLELGLRPGERIASLMTNRAVLLMHWRSNAMQCSVRMTAA